MFPPIRKCCWKELDGLRPQGDLPPIVWQLNALWSTCLETSKVRIKHQRAKSDTTNQRPDFQHRQLVGGWGELLVFLGSGFGFFGSRFWFRIRLC